MKNPLPFNIDDIIELATDSSFNKGEDYYNSGNVKNITHAQNRFEGIVSGTYNYHVVLEVSTDGLDFRCSCPYDHGGICKHSVALALAILDRKYSETLEIKTQSDQDTIKKFKELFKNTDQQKKLNFLKQLLEKDSDLQNQFIEFVKSKTENLDEITGVNIDEIKEKIYDKLSSIDFDDLVEDYDPYYDNYDDDEGYIDQAYDEISSVFEPFKIDAIKFIKKGNLIDAFRLILGMYEGSQNLPGLEDNDYDIFYDDYDDVAFNELNKYFKEITREIEQVVKPDDTVKRVIDLIIQRNNNYNKTISEHNDEENEINIVYNMKDFEGLFLSLLINREIAAYLYQIIRQNNLECLGTAFVLLRIAEIEENEELWIETAEKFAGFELEIAKQLLEKYKQKNKEKNFNRIAKTAFKNWPDSFDLYLVNNLNKETEKNMYVEALKHYTSHKLSIKHYIELREYLDDEQKKEFINKIRKGYHDVFYVQLLNIEKRYNDILSFVKIRKDSPYDFEKIIEPVINIFPDECFVLIKDKCDKAMNSYKRNRETYQGMVKWLKVMAQIESKQNETKQYIKSLYEHKPNLPALKDELRNAKLV